MTINNEFFYKHKERVCFRKLEFHDLDLIRHSKINSWQYTHSFSIPTNLSQRKWFEKIENSDRELVLVGAFPNAETGVLESCGIATFYNIDYYNRSLQIGGHVYPKFRKTGVTLNGWYAGIDFAFEMLNMNRIYGEVLETNLGALSLDRSTMREEGVKRKAIYQSGRYLDSYMFGLLREEWLESDRVKSYGGICNLNIDSPKKKL